MASWWILRDSGWNPNGLGVCQKMLQLETLLVLINVQVEATFQSLPHEVTTAARWSASNARLFYVWASDSWNVPDMAGLALDHGGPRP